MGADSDAGALRDGHELASDTLRTEGNELFKQGRFLQAAAKYTGALKVERDPAAQARLYSNRSAALVKLNKVGKALEDAEQCVKLEPQWDKAYYRKAAVYEAQGRHEQALQVCREGLDKCPNATELAAKAKELGKRLCNEAKVKQQAIPRITQQSKAAADVWEFAQEWLRTAASYMEDEGLGWHPIVAFLPGPHSRVPAADADRAQQVRGEHAFASPDTLVRFATFCREHADVLDARCCVGVVPMPAVVFPQRWKQAHWPFPGEEGVFVQLQSRELCKLWFIRMPGLAQGRRPMEPVEIESDYALLPFLLGDDNSS